MISPLASPGLRPDRPRIAVIGAGPGGLAAAMLLAAQGARVTLFEKDAEIGGRSRTLAAPGGYRFDLGPTFFLYPRILAEIFTACGAELSAEVELIRLDPQYRLVFEGAATLDATPDVPRMEAEIARLCPGDAPGLRSFLAENRRKLEAFRPVLERPFSALRDHLSPGLLRSLALLRPHRSLDQDLARHFRDPLVRLAFSFQSKYLGMSPFRCPSLFTILSFLEYEHGIFHPRGGCGAVAAAMARVAARLGVEIRRDSAVERIAFAGRRAVGVELGGARHAADAVVVNADFAHAIPRLIPDALRQQWSDRRIAGARYSCSTFMLYLGVAGSFPELAHHTVLLAEDYRRNIRQIETGEIPDVPSLYLHHPGASDPSMAPPGHSSLYLLVPVPNLRQSAAAGVDWTQEAPRYRRLALDRLRALGLPDLAPRIRYERMVTPADWQARYAVGFGATFNLSHDLGQMLGFRPRNRFSGVEGVYLVGGGTHPGSGLPVIYEGARITATLLAQDLGLRPAAQGAGVAGLTPACTPAA
ncbi:phytoene desaturase [Siccirubricoccus sp. KC 17139]|uniref:Phytoene desaturase n=1 Tax=Siccirubricoccus soli TaxID=2899147 RepID=A0ABT1D875_9PROT|nr:phytoene desaturase family protein [Siccirubricoccus soli]MCO6418132.1 phytoene desaturase [Siccirubricoccus soli]MCP2684267.1 phytoene desaturase family protein [Siccirubricoccus soli]